MMAGEGGNGDVLRVQPTALQRPERTAGAGQSLLPAIILAYADKRVLPGLQVLLTSLRRHGNIGSTPIVTLTADAAVRDNALVRRLSDDVRLVNIDRYSKIIPDSKRLGVAAYVKGFEAFADHGAHINVMLDADLLCVGDVKDLLCPARSDVRAVQDGCANRLGGYGGGGYVEINTGVLVVNRSAQGDEHVAALVKLARKKVSVGRGIGDQGVINSYIYQKGLCVDLLPLKFNFYWGGLHRAKSRYRYRFWTDAERMGGDARLIHFSHAPKPWEAGAPEKSEPVRRWRRVYRLRRRPTHYGLFDRVVVISLASRDDRWRRFERGLPSAWPFVAPVRVRAVDGLAVKPPQWWGSTRPNGSAWGCFRSHLRVLEDCLNDGVKAALIMEDDAIFVPDFARKVDQFILHLPDDWDLLYFGGWHADEPTAINRHVVQGRHILCNHAYGIRGDAIEAAYRHLTNTDWGTPMPWDNRLALLHPQLRVYAPRTFLVGQAAGWSNISHKRHREHWWRDRNRTAGLVEASLSGEKAPVVVLTRLIEPYELLAHFALHYERLGCEGIMIVSSDCSPRAKAAIEQVRRSAAIAVASHFYTPQDGDDARAWTRALTRETGRWMIEVPLHDFLEFPASLADVIKEAEAAGIDVVSSELVDRVARCGRLTALRSEPSIGEQYPIRCMLSNRRLRAFSRNCALFRLTAERMAAHARPKSSSARRYPVGNRAGYVVHRFSWTSGALSSLADIPGPYLDGGAYYAEDCRRFLEAYARLGRIELDGLDARECGSLESSCRYINAS